MKIAASLPAWFGFMGLVGGGLFERPVWRERILCDLARCAVGAAGLLMAGVCLGLATITPNNTIAVALLTLGGGALNVMIPVSWSICMDLAGNMSGQSPAR